MRKIVLIIAIILLTSGCVKRNADYYDFIAETVISFYQTSYYDVNKVHKDDRDALNIYLSTLTHEEQIIDVTEFIDFKSPSIEKPDSTIWSENKKCYMYYSDLKKKFDDFNLNNPNSVIEAYYKATCNGYYATMYESDFAPSYEATTNNPVHNYVLLKKYKNDTGYRFIYRSNYNGTGLRVNIDLEKKQIIKIYTDQVNADDYLE